MSSSLTPVRIQQNRHTVKLPTRIPSATITTSSSDKEEFVEIPSRPEATQESAIPGRSSGKMKHAKSYDTRKRPDRPEDEVFFVFYFLS